MQRRIHIVRHIFGGINLNQFVILAICRYSDFTLVYFDTQCVWKNLPNIRSCYICRDLLFTFKWFYRYNFILIAQAVLKSAYFTLLIIPYI
jgi:hypothetical protein